MNALNGHGDLSTLAEDTKTAAVSQTLDHSVAEGVGQNEEERLEKDVVLSELQQEVEREALLKKESLVQNKQVQCIGRVPIHVLIPECDTKLLTRLFFSPCTRSTVHYDL